MSKIVLSAAGSAGDIYPVIALAAELRRRGHEAIVATQSEYRARIEAQGVGFHALRPSQDEIESTLGVDTPELVRLTTQPVSGLEFAVRRIAMPYLKSSFEDMQETCADASLVITHTSAFAARLAAEKHGVPWLSAVLAPFAFMSAYDPPVFVPLLTQVRKLFGPAPERAVLHVVKLAIAPWTDTYRHLREDLGLPERPNPLFEGQFSQFGTLALYSKHFASAQPDFPQATSLTGFCYYDGDGDARGMDPALEAFLKAGPPPVVFTIGSALVHEPRRFFETAAEAAALNGERAILLAGAYAPQLRKVAGPNVYVAADYVPHAKIFPRASTIVHHGGIGTTSQALRAGRPQLVVPYSADQPDNAARLERMGVARSIPIGQFLARRAALDLAHLTAPSYAANAAAVASKLAAENGPGIAADVIERVLETKRARRYA